MTTTFKFFRPNGDCRRVTFTNVPELAAINELVDGMVEAPAEHRQLTYVDSEGDRVVIKTSRDVVEAVSDAREAGAKTIKVLIRPRGGGKCGKAGGKCGSASSARPQRPSRWCSGRGGRYGPFAAHQGEFSNEFREFANVIGAIFPGIFREAESTSAEDREAPEDKAAEDAASPAATPSTAVEADKRAASPAPTQHSGAEAEEAEASTGTEEAEASTGTEEAEASTGAKETENTGGITAGEDGKEEDDLDAKAALLRDMGFELPLDVARNMIAEMGGRMDLIVRALVANSK